MPSEAVFEIKEKYLLVNIQGEAFPPEMILETMKETVKRSVDNDLKKAMICRSQVKRQKASTMDFFKFGEYLVSLNLYEFKFALVFPKAMHADNIGFFETVTVNLGLRIKLFSDYDLAEEWLLAE